MTLDEGATAVITGAGGALGRELALIAASRAMNVVLADIDAHGLSDTAAEVASMPGPGEVAFLRMDVGDAKEVDTLAALATKRFGGTDVLFNNAAVGMDAPLWATDVAQWRQLVHTNLMGVAWGVRSFVPDMMARGRGHVVNVACASGFFHQAGTGAYSATKAAVVALSESLANDLSRAGREVGVTVLAPASAHPGRLPSDRSDTRGNPPANDDWSRTPEAEWGGVEFGRPPVPLSEIAEAAFVAIERNTFYAFPHGWVPGLFELRSHAVAIGGRAFDPQDWALV